MAEDRTWIIASVDLEVGWVSSGDEVRRVRATRRAARRLQVQRLSQARRTAARRTSPGSTRPRPCGGLCHDQVHAGERRGARRHGRTGRCGSRRSPSRAHPRGRHDRWVQGTRRRWSRPRTATSPLREVADLDLLRVAIDADHVLSGPRVQREALPRLSGVCSRRLSRSGMAPPDVVGQAAVRERDVVVTLEYDDLR